MSTEVRHYSRLDRLLIELQRGLTVALADAPAPALANPAGDAPLAALSETERLHVAGLMRVNHSGEVSAQALYYGQAAVARSAATKAHLLQAAAEEGDHLAWCAQRLRELDSDPSRLNLLWYGGAFLLGAGAGLIGDRWSLGFVIETERQVEAHLGEHLERLPADDDRSRAILARMQSDEAEHGAEARQAGGVDLPQPIPKLMALAAAVMKALAYRI